MILLPQHQLDKPRRRNNDIRHQLRKEPGNPAWAVHETFRATISDATLLELQSCITDIYLMGSEDGRVLEREVY